VADPTAGDERLGDGVVCEQLGRGVLELNGGHGRKSKRVRKQREG